MSKTALEYWMHWHAIIVFGENGGNVIRIMSLFISLTRDILRCWHVVRANGCPGSHGKPFGVEGDLQMFHKSPWFRMIWHIILPEFDAHGICRPSSPRGDRSDTPCRHDTCHSSQSSSVAVRAKAVVGCQFQKGEETTRINSYRATVLQEWQVRPPGETSETRINMWASWDLSSKLANPGARSHGKAWKHLGVQPRSDIMWRHMTWCDLMWPDDQENDISKHIKVKNVLLAISFLISCMIMS